MKHLASLHHSHESPGKDSRTGCREIAALQRVPTRGLHIQFYLCLFSLRLISKLAQHGSRCWSMERVCTRGVSASKTASNLQSSSETYLRYYIDHKEQKVARISLNNHQRSETMWSLCSKRRKALPERLSTVP